MEANQVAIGGSQYPEEIRTATKKYEEFIKTRLEPDLAQVVELRDNIYTQMSEYLKLKEHIEIIRKQELSELETKVDLGLNFYAKAFVPDTRHIFVNVGFGFHLQMSLDEADMFIDQKVKHMERQADRYTEEANQIRAKLKMMYGALMEVFDTINK